MSTTQLLFIFWAALLAVVYGIVTTRWIKGLPSGGERVQEIAAAISEGARAYLARQYKTIAFAGTIIFLLVGYYLNWSTAIGFAVGAVLSGAAGFIGMNVSVMARWSHYWHAGSRSWAGWSGWLLCHPAGHGVFQC
jgi:K(+)-stimulated pyrophosphate-energized sodium pump